MAQVALLAEFEVKAQDLDLFIAAARREVDAVHANEPSCVTFEVVLLNGEQGRGVFIEIFKDQAAAEAHRTTPHFTAFFDEIAGLDVKFFPRRGAVLGGGTPSERL
jgi:quinol monooxygenase YgiN